MINVIIDEFTPCLKDVNTGELVQTEVIRIKRKSFLKKYNKKNGWYTNWEKLADENEIYALVIEGTVDIQGLIALTPNKDMKAVYISWMCTAPQNNKIISEDVRYLGVGGHLFAIAAKKSGRKPKILLKRLRNCIMIWGWHYPIRRFLHMQRRLIIHAAL